MELTDSRKFNRFISNKKEDVFRILSKKLSFPLTREKFDDTFQDASIILYNKINSKNLTTLECKIRKDGIESSLKLPVLADEANNTLFSFLVSTCYRQLLKYNAKQRNNNGDVNKRYETKINSISESSGMARKEVLDMLCGYDGIISADKRHQIIEMDGDISNQQIKEILSKFSESDNSTYREILFQAMKTLAPRCRELLRNFHSRKTNWTEVAFKLGMGGADSAKSAASRCRQTLYKRCHDIERNKLW